MILRRLGGRVGRETLSFVTITADALQATLLMPLPFIQIGPNFSNRDQTSLRKLRP